MHHNPQFITSPRRLSARDDGFSLIELMVAITIGMLIVAALSGLFVSTSRTNREMTKVNRLIENGRFAMQFLESDIVHAGFWGTFVPQFSDLTSTVAPTDTPTAVPDPCLAYNATDWTGAHKSNLIGIPVQAYDASAAVCTGVATNKKADTDMLVVRHAETCLPGEANCEADVAGKLYFQASLCEDEITAAPPLRYVLDTANFTLNRSGCTRVPPALATAGTLASKRKFVSNLYYIRDYAVTAGDGIPTLVRSQFDLSGGALAHQGAVALIEGIEGFRVEFGIDNLSVTGAPVNYAAVTAWPNPAIRTSPTNRGDGVPDVFCATTTACSAIVGTNALDGVTLSASSASVQALALANVTVVKLYVLARSEASPGYTDTKTYNLGSTTLGPFNDQNKRHVFSTTVRIPNVLGRRESP